MSDKILPATDAEVTALKECIVRFDAGEVTLGGPQFASGCERLIARIEADRATIRAKDALIAELVDALRSEHMPSGTGPKPTCLVCALIAKAKEAGQ